MKRKKLVAANWKMNLTLQEGEALISALLSGLPDQPTCDILIAPPFTHLQTALTQTRNSPIGVAAQHCHEQASGAYTGEVSAEMLKSLGIRFVITGHSERRQLFHEDDNRVRQKVDAIVRAGLTPIFCCGEPMEIREAGKQVEYVREQLKSGLFHLAPALFERVIIAYEPIWAIGTGQTATPEQAQEMHLAIRNEVADRYFSKAGEELRILYGGSVKADNAQSIFSMPDVDGSLVGGASLDADSFLKIIDAAC